MTPTAAPPGCKGRTALRSSLSWAYDADGNRTAFTDSRGTTTTYRRDASGRVAAVSHPALGEATFTHDRSGRILSATAGELVQEWVYRYGSLAEHSRADRSDPGTADVTLIGRDGDGRITGLARAGAVTRYGYDGAGQMVSAATTGNGAQDTSVPAVVSEWVYDAGGRLVQESAPGGSRTYEYDTAGQLVSVTEPDGSRTEYVHDGLGRRTRLIGVDGSWTEYAWGPTGHLNSTTDRTPDGIATSRHELRVDALGELAGVDGTELWWDTANPFPTLAGIGDGQVLSLPGGVTWFGDAWMAPGWRSARPTDRTDPWAVIGAPTIPNPAPGGAPGAGTAGLAGLLPAGITLTGNGGLDIAGLEWLGARAYDPASRGFLSTDPLTPVLGAGWDGNRYAYAGNNPLNTTDPTGLRPLTDADLQAYDQSAESHWEYVAAGVAIGVGVALMCTGVGGPVGMVLLGAASGALVSGGVSVGMQKASTGTVDWGRVGSEAAMGAVAGGVGGAAAFAAKALAGSATVGRVASSVSSSRVGTAVSSAGSRVGSAVTAGVSRVSARAGNYLKALPLQQMGMSAVMRGSAPLAVQYALGGIGSLGGGYVDSRINEEAYGGAEMFFDGAAGVALTHFPGASDLGRSPGWMTHSFAAYGGAHAGAIVETVKTVSGEVMNQNTGTSPW